MRNTDEVYWTTSLPRDHEALRELDAYSQEWGGLSRAEATRRLLIEWTKIRRGQSISGWIAQTASLHGGEPARLEPMPRERAVNKVSSANPVAKAASRVLDD
jgi:hypothetical protein